MTQTDTMAGEESAFARAVREVTRGEVPREVAERMLPKVRELAARSSELADALEERAKAGRWSDIELRPDQERLRALHGSYVVYCICVDGEAEGKIGYSSDIAVRLSQLQIGSPRSLYVAWVYPTEGQDDARRVEARVHAAIADSRLRGEWFDMFNGARRP